MVLTCGAATAITWHGSVQHVGAPVLSSTHVLSHGGGLPHVWMTRPYSNMLIQLPTSERAGKGEKKTGRRKGMGEWQG